MTTSSFGPASADSRDLVVPTLGALSRRLGDTVTVNIIPGADHFDVVDPDSKAWTIVLDSVKNLLAAHP